MRNIKNKKELIERLKDILAMERIARERYIEDIADFSEKDIRSKINSVKKDEDRHIMILSNLISYLQRKSK